MRKGWSIGKHRVEVEVIARQMTVRVDAASPPVLAMRSNLLGTWPLTVGKRVVELRRVRSIDIARNELWVSGVKVPTLARGVTALLGFLMINGLIRERREARASRDR